MRICELKVGDWFHLENTPTVHGKVLRLNKRSVRVVVMGPPGARRRPMCETWSHEMRVVRATGISGGATSAPLQSQPPAQEKCK